MKKSDAFYICRSQPHFRLDAKHICSQAPFLCSATALAIKLARLCTTWAAERDRLKERYAEK